MYHVISTGAIAIILYLISYFFYRSGFYTLNDHRRFWNIILSLTFLLAGIAGLFLALQITYKWNIPFIKSVLKWHVECGIGLVFAGIFHFIWHLSYFTKIFVKAETEVKSEEYVAGTTKQNTINLMIIGFVSTSVQLLLIREIMNIAGGYELITGTFLGSWLISSAAGAAMARRSPLMNIRKINMIFATGPLVSLLLLLTLERLFLNSGETPSFFLSVILTIIPLFPFCFVSGFTFIKLLNLSEKSSDFHPGKAFSIETTGGIIAGVAVSVVTAGVLNTYQLLLLIIILNFTYILISFYIKEKKVKIITATGMVFFTIIVLSLNPDQFFRQQLLHGINVRNSRDTPYGNITTAVYGGEKSIYYNQRLQSYSNDEIEREENIHYSMLQYDSPKKVLIISGDIKSNLKEIMKYEVKRVVFVERDPALIDPELKKDNSLLQTLTIKNDDAFSFIKHTKEDFDVVILLLPPPSTLLLNRFYTTEFFSEIKKRIGSKGIFTCSPGSGENYYSKESVILYSSIYNSLHAVFRNVRPVVGNKLYFIASDAELSSSFCSLSDKKGIKNIYVNSDYLSDDLMEKKSADVIAVIDPGVKQNTFGFPVACFHYQSYNLSKNLNEKIPSVVLLILIFIIPLFSVRRKNLVMFSSAAALSGFEIIILLVLQTTIGYMYLLTGLIMASLMTGLAFGSGFNMKRSGSVIIWIISLSLIIFYISIGLISNKLTATSNSLVSIILLVFIIFIPSALTGQLFSLMTKRKETYSDTSSVYSADLAGSALGFVITSGLAIPALGIRTTIILLSTVIFAALLFGTVGNKY
jgi:spermidine synthase